MLWRGRRGIQVGGDVKLWKPGGQGRNGEPGILCRMKKDKLPAGQMSRCKKISVLDWKILAAVLAMAALIVVRVWSQLLRIFIPNTNNSKYKQSKYKTIPNIQNTNHKNSIWRGAKQCDKTIFQMIGKLSSLKGPLMYVKRGQKTMPTIINQISQISEIPKHKIFQQSVKDKYLFKQFLKSKILQLFQMSEAQEHKVFPKGKGDRNNAIRH